MSRRRLALITGREIKSLFLSPVAYIVIAVFLVVTGWFFFASFFVYDMADLRRLFDLFPLVLSFVVPAVTMRLISEELHSGSYEALVTLPVGVTRIILGKFMASVVMVLVMVVPTVSYAVFVSFMGDLDWGPVLGGYIGVLFLTCAYCGIGIFASSVTKNQIVAYIVGLSICVFLTTLDEVLAFLPGNVADLLTYVGVDFHFGNFAKGVVDSRDMIYFVSISAVALYASVKALIARR